MRLVSFSVEKYRSITKAHRIRVGDQTILIGPNNEGKSNILRALVTGMSILIRGPAKRAIGPVRKISPTFIVGRRYYDWEKDFPLHLQGNDKKGETVIVFEFELTNTELEALRTRIKSNLSGTLPIRISIGQREAKVRVAKQGPGAKALSEKSGMIARFIVDRLDFEHIPAVRTAESAQRIVDELVERELYLLVENPEYVKALKEVEKIQQPLLDALSKSMKQTLVKFLPNVRNVKLQITDEERAAAFSQSCRIIVDDGTPTLLQFKGDGVQSLAALGIMRHASERRGTSKNLVIAIEEPESHLHPYAIHELKAVLDELSKKHQIVISSHCPLFVDRGRISSNILVSNKRARPAKTIEEVRTILGVRASDNLRHAELVLLVEGEDDKLAVAALLREEAEALEAALDNGTIAIDTLGGASNLCYKASLVRNSLCLVHCFLDDDKAAHEVFTRARTEGVLNDINVNFSVCNGMIEAEIEDLYDKGVYESLIQSAYRVSLQSPKFRTKKKWSERMRDVFRQQGKEWDERVEREVKQRVAEAVAHNPKNALNPNKKTSFRAFAQALTQILTELSRSRE